MVEDKDAQARRDRLLTAAKRLYGLTMHPDQIADLSPRILRLSDDALRLFEEFRWEAMERARSSRGLAAGWHGKSPGRALRLALVFELLSFAAGTQEEPQSVSADAMARAAAYHDYATAMFDRVTAGLAISEAEEDAAHIARYILSTQSSLLNERNLYQQPGWAWFRKAEPRKNALHVLAEMGWIRSHFRVGQGRPRGDWDVSPRLWERGR